MLLDNQVVSATMWSQIYGVTVFIQDCCQYHQAKDGDGWVEYKGSLVLSGPQKVF